MDPISATGLIASVAQLIDYTTKVIKYANAVKDAPVQRNELSREAASLLRLLTDLQYRADIANHTDPWIRGLRSLEGEGGPLDQFKRALGQIATLLKPAKGFKKYGKALSWPLTREQIKDSLSQIGRLQGLISAALSGDQFALSLAIKDDVSEISKAQKESKKSQVLNWISTRSYASKQRDTLERRQEGTGYWFLKASKFEDWKNCPDKTLCCFGFPGAGKTVMTSIVIDHLEHTYGDQNVAIAYIYFNFKEQEDQTTINLITSLLMQVARQRPDVSLELRDLHQSSADRERRPTLGRWTDALSLEIKAFDRVFVIIDALDECSEGDGTRTSFLRELNKLFSGGHVNLFITSRPLQGVELHPSKTIYLEISGHPKDIRLYLDKRIGHEGRLLRIIGSDTNLRNEIIDSIVGKSGGMFLAAQLHLASLATRHSCSKVRKALRGMPEELDRIYDEAMGRIASQSRDDISLANQVLCWIIYALRPLHVSELQQAIAIELEDEELDFEATPDAVLLVDVCAGLVTIDQESNIIRLVHYTTQEYFQRKRAELFPNAQDDLAIACLTYVLLTDFREGCCLDENQIRERLKKFPFLAYAAIFWGAHFRSLPDDPDNMSDQLALRFLHNRCYFSSACQAMLYAERIHFSCTIPTLATPLQMTARFGLDNPVRRLLEDGAEVGTINAYGQTALSIAAEYGHRTVMLLLIRKGAKTGQIDFKGSSALYKAATNGHDLAVQLLLAETPDAHDRNSLWQSALNTALFNNDRFAAQRLLENEHNEPYLLDIVGRVAVRDILKDLLEHDVSAISDTVSFRRNFYDLACRRRTIYHSANTYGSLFGNVKEHSQPLPASIAETRAVLYWTPRRGMAVIATRLLSENSNLDLVGKLLEADLLILPDINIAKVGLLFNNIINWNTEYKLGETVLARGADEGYTSLHKFLTGFGVEPGLENQRSPFRLVQQLFGQGHEVWVLKFSYDASKLATGGKSAIVLIYETTNYTVIQKINSADSEFCYLSWSLDGLKLMGCTLTGKAHVWDTTTWSVIFMLDQFEGSVSCGVWSPVGTIIITGSQDREYGLCMWDNNGVLKCKIDNYPVHDLQVSPDGKRLVVLSVSGVHVYDLDTLGKIQEWILDDVKLSSISISKDSRYILLSMNGSTGLALVELESGEVLRTFQGSLHDQIITRNCFGGTNDEYVVSGSEDGRVYIWTEDGDLFGVLESSKYGCVSDVAWHPQDSSIFACVSDDGSTNIWSISL